MPHRILALAALLAALSSHVHADTDTFWGVVATAPKPGDDRPGMQVDDGECVRYVGLTGTAISWHLDAKVKIPLCDLRPGTRVRVTGSYWTASSVEVSSLGPYAMQFSVEDWIAEVSGDRAWLVLSDGEILTMEALASRSWFVRSAVTKALQDRGTGVLKLLAWSRRSTDREVRARAEMLLTRLGWQK